MKKWIKNYAAEEFKNIVASLPSSQALQDKQLEGLSQLLLALGMIQEKDYFFQAQARIEQALVLQAGPTPLQIMILARMALAAYFQGDTALSSSLKTRLSTGIDKLLLAEEQDVFVFWAIAYLAFVEPSSYEHYKDILRNQILTLYPKLHNEDVDIHDYLWTLTLGLQAAARANQRSDYDDYMTAFKAVSKLPNIPFDGPLIKMGPSRHWMHMILLSASYEAHDLKHFNILSNSAFSLSFLDKASINSMDKLLAAAQKYLLSQSLDAEAGRRLSLRPEHMFCANGPLEPPKNDDKKPLSLQRLLEGPIVWQPYFQPVGTFWALPKDKSRLNPIPVWVYAHWEGFSMLTFTVHQPTDPRSLAGLSMAYSGATYPDGSRGFYFVSQLASYDPATAYTTPSPYRLGSLMIDLAIRYSVLQGLEGKISLHSAYNSGPFYLKLGFMPESISKYSRLLLENTYNGGEMYLPEASRVVWNKKWKDHAFQLRPLPRLEKVALSLRPDSSHDQWLHTIIRLKQHAASSIAIQGLQPWGLIETNHFYDALRANQSLSKVVLNAAAFLTRPLSSLLAYIDLQTNLVSLKIENYTDEEGAWDDAAIEALALLVKKAPRLARVCLNNLVAKSQAFSDLIVTVIHSEKISAFVCSNMQLSAANAAVLTRLQIARPEMQTQNERAMAITGTKRCKLKPAETPGPIVEEKPIPYAATAGRSVLFPQASRSEGDPSLEICQIRQNTIESAMP